MPKTADGHEIFTFKGQNGEMAFDGRAVTVTNRTTMRFSSKDPLIIPLESIESVYVKSPTPLRALGHIQIITPDANGHRSLHELSRQHSHFDDKAVHIYLFGGSARRFADRVTQAVAARGSEAVPLRYAELRAKYGIPDNTLLAVGTSGFCAFDGSQLTRAGFSKWRTASMGVKRVPLSSINAILLKSPGPLAQGFIQFTVPGAVIRNTEHGSMREDDNAVFFTPSQEGAFIAIRDAIEAAQAEQRSPSLAPQSPVIQSSVIEQIAQLAALRDSDIITTEEFDVKKAELLNRF